MLTCHTVDCARRLGGAAVMAAPVLPMIGRDDHVIARRRPNRPQMRQSLIHAETGIIHFRAFMEKAVPQTVQRADVQVCRMP